MIKSVVFYCRIMQSVNVLVATMPFLGCYFLVCIWWYMGSFHNYTGKIVQKIEHKLSNHVSIIHKPERAATHSPDAKTCLIVKKQTSSVKRIWRHIWIWSTEQTICNTSAIFVTIAACLEKTLLNIYCKGMHLSVRSVINNLWVVLNWSAMTMTIIGSKRWKAIHPLWRCVPTVDTYSPVKMSLTLTYSLTY